MKPFIPWVGGKTALRPVLYQLFPARLKRYVEVFGGSGALLFGREPQKGVAEVYNDYNSDLVDLFTCVRDRPLALMDELGYLPLNSREEFEALRRFLRQKEPDAPYLREELELCQKRFPPPEAEELTQVLLDQPMGCETGGGLLQGHPVQLRGRGRFFWRAGARYPPDHRADMGLFQAVGGCGHRKSQLRDHHPPV